MAKVAKGRWQPIFVVQVYRMVKAGMPDVDICKTLKVSRQTYYNWLREYPELQQAVDMARKEVEDSNSLHDWLYMRLSPELKAIWDQIRKFEKEKNGVAKIELLLQDNGRRVRQQLFLYALCMSRFSPSVAMRKVNLTKRELDDWINNDPDFAALVEEVQWHKGNFFEESLVKLVQQGNPSAILFANKSYNGSRGYSPKQQVDVNVSGQVVHGILDLADLIPYLTESSRLEVLDAIRKREEDQQRRERQPTPYEMIGHTIAQPQEAT